MIRQFIIYMAIIFIFMPVQLISGTHDDTTQTVISSDIRLNQYHDGNGGIFSQANDFYADGYYSEAIGLYKKILAAGYHSAALYYNIGNAYFRSNEFPSAILFYERAALLAPGDEDIKFNLELARMHTRDRIDAIPEFFLNRWWKGVRDLTGFRNWAKLSALAFISSLVMLSVFLLGSSVVIKKIFFWLAALFLASSIITFSFGFDQRNYMNNHNMAIVFSPVVSVKSSPDINSTDLFVLHEGTRVRVEDSIGNWREIRLSDGNKGWLSKDALEMI
jgi:tetratricopeptide (TPR) repeat protein